jgi:beta-glucosidase
MTPTFFSTPFAALLASAILLTTFSCSNKPSESSTSYRDLNKNGRQDVYEDSSQPLEARLEDLLQQMTLEEKAGLMFINGASIKEDGSLDPATERYSPNLDAPKMLQEKHMKHFNLWQVPSPEALARWHNNLQKLAEASRLGIPVTIASDPRNHFSNTIFSMSAEGFSQWCETLGFAAIGDEALARQFADIARQEYLAVGIREALHPQIDLATEPRWARISGTFGEDAQLTARLGAAYIRGFQGEALGNTSVACMTKHFSGGGPQKEGLDAHFEFHKGQVYPGNNFAYHLIPFEAAFAANTAAIMPYYGIPLGQTSEEVAFGYNKDIITGLLREKYGFEGVVCTDWGLVTDTNLGTAIWPARAWGVEQLSIPQRVQKIIEAGVDQFGGESIPEVVVQLVQEGTIAESRIDESVRRILRQKFKLGLFDNPYVDEAAVTTIIGKAEFMAAGEASQRRAMTLLKNEGDILPLPQGRLKLYVRNMDKEVAARYGTVVNTPEEADIAILRLQTPWYPIETDNFIARGFHHGDLDFKGAQKDSIMQLLRTVPTIVDLYLDRPAVFPDISAAARGLLANFGASDAAVLDVIFGLAQPEGKLPFELPSSMEAVRNQKEDLPYDSKDPLYRFGYGLRYSSARGDK